MPNIIKLWDLESEELEFFRDSISDAVSENGVEWDESGKLFQSIHLMELSWEYRTRLNSIASRVGCIVDMRGNPHPVLHQNVHCHRDRINGSPLSMIVNISRNPGILHLHEERWGEILESASLETGKIILFNHHAWHSVTYWGDLNKYISLVRASVEFIRDI